ncbi:hypothetical protein ARMGADRAFT_1028095 [Armillaria gallica]|uniref:Uncharacterized protein n=1 Tax=Armillaria gallica TaxID=47427 RepID=A0A2H3DPL7_ARMGA|nr:hypothetical protein ARMGADRAFT_1028095 [Armillaria gallica]
MTFYSQSKSAEEMGGRKLAENGIISQEYGCRRRPGNRVKKWHIKRRDYQTFRKIRIDERRTIWLFVPYPTSTSNGIYETDHSHFMPPLDREDSTNDRPIHFVAQLRGSKRRDSVSNQDGSSRRSWPAKRSHYPCDQPARARLFPSMAVYGLRALFGGAVVMEYAGLSESIGVHGAIFALLRDLPWTNEWRTILCGMRVAANL